MDEIFSEEYVKKSELRRALVKERRIQLGMTHAQMAELIKRKSLKAKALEEFEEGRSYVRPADIRRMEDVLKLPIGFLGRVLDTFIDNAADPLSTTTAHIWPLLEIHSRKSTAVKQVPCCPRCAENTQLFISRRGLEHEVVLVKDGHCVCEGTATGFGGGPELDLRLAIWLTKMKKILVLGGGQDIEDACNEIKFCDVKVLRGPAAANSTSGLVRGIDLCILARGEIGHAASARYINAIERLPATTRPRVIHPRSSNISAIVDEIFWNVL